MPTPALYSSRDLTRVVESKSGTRVEYFMRRGQNARQTRRMMMK